MWSRVRARFREAPVTLGPTPGAREAWHKGRDTYAVWLVRVDVPAVRARVDEALAHLDGHGLGRRFGEPHVTVFVAGFPSPVPRHDDDVAEEALAAQARALAGAPPFVLEVGDLVAFTSCAVLEVHDPGGGLAALRDRLAPHGREVRFAPYEPHVTVAAFGDTRPTGPVATAIDAWSPRPRLAVEVLAVELVAIDASGRDPRLRTVRTVPCGGDSSSWPAR
ncbi:MAG: 2'-5' RNA ligase family protein [Myxococcota bacterium]